MSSVVLCGSCGGVMTDDGEEFAPSHEREQGWHFRCGPPPGERPAPEFKVKVARSADLSWEGLRPFRFYYGTDGDWTNQLVWFGVEFLQWGYCNAIFSIGLELTIPPKLFWLLPLLGLPG